MVLCLAVGGERPARAAGATSQPVTAPASRPTSGPEKWESVIQRFEQNDKVSPVPAGATVFVGSSTIAGWGSIPDDFKRFNAVGRGFGGSTSADVLHYVDRIVIDYKPSKVVYYAGDNDIAAGVSPPKVLENFQAFVEKVRAATPNVKIYFVSIKPSPIRAKVWDQARQANEAIRRYVRKTPGLMYVDCATPMLDQDGKARPELFKKDMLHMNRGGYELWIPIITAALEQDMPATAPGGDDRP